jgi:hypothetical protein
MKAIGVAAAAAFAMCTAAFAGGPTLLSDDDMDQIVAGGVAVLGGQNPQGSPPDINIPPTAFGGKALGGQNAVPDVTCSPGVAGLAVHGMGNSPAGCP